LESEVQTDQERMIQLF